MIKLKVILPILIGIVFLVIIVSGETSTTLEILNVNIAPQLVSPIPNQTWAINTNLTDAFDLDDYFLDNDAINYTASSVDSITIIINETTRKVSFYPANGFSGIRTVIFTASDGNLSSDSNLVTLNVTNDVHAPTWSNPSISPGTIRQNTITRFSATWQDDVSLNNFILSINQGGTWINQTSTSFSGLTNISTYSLQISAPAGTVVFWYIIGFDTAGNMNSTSVKNFTVQTSPTAPPVVDDADDDDEDSDNEVAAETTNTPAKEKDFTNEPKDGFKIDLVKGEEKTISLRITNTATTTELFNISISGVDKFDYVLSKFNFTIAPGSSEIITLSLKAKQSALPDLYYGSIRIRTNFKRVDLPLIIELNALVTKLSLNLSITNKKEFLPLQEITANITITNILDIQPSDIYLYYALVDFKGNVLDSKTEQFVLNGKSVELQRILNIPESATLGSYIFFARSVTNGSIAVDSDLFEIGKRTTLSSFIMKYIWIILIIASVIITILIAIAEYRSRKKLNLLNIYILTNELSRLVKENNFIEAEKVFIKIKNYYSEPISEEIFNNKEKLDNEIKEFAEKIDKNLYNKKEPVQNKNESDEKDKDKKDEKKSDDKVQEKNENKEDSDKNKDKPEQKEKKEESSEDKEDNKKVSSKSVKKKVKKKSNSQKNKKGPTKKKNASKKKKR